jgi:hypothetical protein
MTPAPELLRFLRHALAPFVVIAVERGWLPDGAQNDATEVLVILAGFGVAYLWSRRNERQRAAAEQAPQATPEDQ